MTGIERLRELVDGTSPITPVRGITKTSYDMEHPETFRIRLRDFLADIADQIEREQVEAAADHAIVASVASEMERHVSGHEGMEDSPVARWARELREALGGKGRDHAADVSMSAYDLLPEEDRDAIAWVREHGGLERVKDLLEWVVGHCSTRQQLDFDFWLSGRVMHELGFEEDVADRDEVERRLLARLMPEGMEWPRFEDGESVTFGGEFIGFEETNESIDLVIFGKHSYRLQSYKGSGHGRAFDYGERVKRPAPEDSWECLEKDATRNPFDYCKDAGIDVPDPRDGIFISDVIEPFAKDLVRRAKALAERDR